MSMNHTKAFKIEETYLDEDAYNSSGPPLILGPTRARSKYATVYSYQVGKQMVWSLTPPRSGVPHK